jgi:hypothetical protein
MAKDENFGLQRCARPQQPGPGVPDQLEEIAHRRDYRPIRWRSTAVFGFPVGTAVKEARNWWDFLGKKRVLPSDGQKRGRAMLHHWPDLATCNTSNSGIV